MADEKKACGTCKFWNQDPVYPSGEMPTYGLCLAIELVPYIDKPENQAYVEDSSGYYAAVRCKQAFGCVLHEAKP